ncbi:hypothetical protein CTAYLR_009162 [Chrysophaeum taylorii]|uniref:rRNA adenine N(6)-methyltransferase n=1 Tax=Chrysophaeum taylorii TaxID=2483200 RepID=A0AAD7UI16_9STRA|nr:hypothetical protein CTAYLR_009162 [Chrysophaeum taylorii]
MRRFVSLLVARGASAFCGGRVRMSVEPDRPPTLPAGKFRPKQSLGQNYLADQNIAVKITKALEDASEGGHRVVELGPGLGALTRLLVEEYPEMLAVEIDQRAVDLLRERHEELSVIRSDVLEIDYTKLRELRARDGGRLSVIGNLPYYITSQILFALADHHDSVRRAVVTMQWEVAQRVVAAPRTKDYGILSVVFQLYSNARIAFKIPPTAFYPKPKVDSALVVVDFPVDRPRFPVDPRKLRTVVTTAFRQRRKMLRQSLKSILPPDFKLPDNWSTKRPEELKPRDFLELTAIIFGRIDPDSEPPSGTAIWRKVKKADDDGGGSR